VARGYYRRDDLTNERFVEWRDGEWHERVYRTGDRVRRLSGGAIEFLGRTDDQVKVRGHRVELGEVEHVLRTHPGVAQGVVVVRDDDLVAYAVAKQAGYAVSHNDRPTVEKIREYISVQLPEYMVPRTVMLLDALPLTSNGKVDKSKLPSPEAGAEAANDSFIAPRTEVEQQLASIWAEVLKKDRIGVNESFLALGGHSLLAIRVLGKISKSFGVRLPLRLLFENATVEVLASEIARARA
jgi:acyl carrier protein